MFASATFERVAPVLADLGLRDLASQYLATGERIRRAVWDAGLVSLQDAEGPIFAYEVDGLGNTVLMDDANVSNMQRIYTDKLILNLVVIHIRIVIVHDPLLPILILISSVLLYIYILMMKRFLDDEKGSLAAFRSLSWFCGPGR